MKAVALLEELHRRRVRLSVDGNDITWSGPSQGGMNVELIRRLKDEKTRLLDILTGVDPRPDIQADSALWTRLLRSASPDAHEITGLYGTLAGLRAFGATLVADHGKLRITAGEIDANEYAQFRAQYLTPVVDQIKELLAELETTYPSPVTNGREQAA